MMMMMMMMMMAMTINKFILVIREQLHANKKTAQCEIPNIEIYRVPLDRKQIIKISWSCIMWKMSWKPQTSYLAAFANVVYWIYYNACGGELNTSKCFVYS